MSKKNKLVLENSSPKKKTIENVPPKNKFKPKLKKKKMKQLVSRISKAEGNEEIQHSEQDKFKEIDKSNITSNTLPKKNKKRKKKKSTSDTNVSDVKLEKSDEFRNSNTETEPDGSVDALKKPKRKKKSKNKQNKPVESILSVESAQPIPEGSEDIDKGSEIDWDSYPSDTDDEERERRFKKMNEIKVNSDESSEESDISDSESKTSNISEFDADSCPSDSDDETKKKKGLPINAVPSAELEEKEKRTIFVGNLPYSVERSELKKWFSKFGKVECVRLRSAPIANPEIPRKVAVIKKTFHESRSNIHAYIRFKTVEAANNATQANGALFGEHILRVDHSKHEGKYDAKKAVFVGNVPFAVEENTLRNFFSECGEIDNVRIVRDKNTGVGKGFAYVNFKCSTSVPLALKLDGEVIEKRELRVKPIKYQKKNAKVNQRSFNPKFRHRNFNKTKDKGNKKTFKSNKFQGEMSKRKMKKPHKKKSVIERKHEKLSKILTSKKEKSGESN